LDSASRIRAKREAAAIARRLAAERTNPDFVKYLLSFAREREDQANLLERDGEGRSGTPGSTV
jgi:hypothetical protein